VYNYYKCPVVIDLDMWIFFAANAHRRGKLTGNLCKPFGKSNRGFPPIFPCLGRKYQLTGKLEQKLWHIHKNENDAFVETFKMMLVNIHRLSQVENPKKHSKFYTRDA
jgi:hypothetical protein